MHLLPLHPLLCFHIFSTLHECVSFAFNVKDLKDPLSCAGKETAENMTYIREKPRWPDSPLLSFFFFPFFFHESITSAPQRRSAVTTQTGKLIKMPLELQPEESSLFDHWLQCVWLWEWVTNIVQSHDGMFWPHFCELPGSTFSSNDRFTVYSQRAFFDFSIWDEWMETMCACVD